MSVYSNDSFQRPALGVNLPNNRFTFNGKKLNDLAVIEKITRTLVPQSEVQAYTVPGSHGQVFGNFRYGVRSISVNIRIVEETYEQALEARTILASSLYSEKPAELVLNDTDYSNFALLTSEVELEKVYNTLQGTLEFTCYDPFNYGETIEVLVGASGVDGIYFGGPGTPIGFRIENTDGLNLPDGFEFSINGEGRLGNISIDGPLVIGVNIPITYDNYSLFAGNTNINNKLNLDNSNIPVMPMGNWQASISPYIPGFKLIYKERYL